MWIASLLAAFSTWRRYRNTRRELARLDDRALRDIGLNRTEIKSRAWQCAQGSVRV